MKRIFIIPLVVVTLATSACGLGQEDPVLAEPPATTTTTVGETTSTSTTTTTTLPPTTTTTVPDTTTTTIREIGCSAEYEASYPYDRPYSFIGVWPAPLNVLSRENVEAYGDEGDRTNVISGVFLGKTTEPFTVTSTWQTEAIIATFCFQDVHGNWVTARLSLSIIENLDWEGLTTVAVNGGPGSIGNALPFGPDPSKYHNVWPDACDGCPLTPREVIDKLVVGQQYVMEIGVESPPLGLPGYEEEEAASQRAMANNRAIIAWLLGEGPEPPEGTIGALDNAIWFDPMGGHLVPPAGGV